MKRISILSVIMAILSVSFISAQNTSEKEVLFKNGTVKGVFAKGELQRGNVSFYFNKSEMLFEGKYIPHTDADSGGFNFRGTLVYKNEKYTCLAALTNNLAEWGADADCWVQTIYKRGSKKRSINISHLYIAEYCPAEKFSLVDKIVSKEKEAEEWERSHYREPFSILVNGKHSIYYKNGNIYTGEKGDEELLIEYIWANGDKYEGYAANSAVYIKEKLDPSVGVFAMNIRGSSTVNFEDVNRILSTDKFPHYINREGCFKLKDGREIKISTLYDIYDCESKKLVYNASQLSGEGKTPSEIVAIRDSVVLAQEAKKQQLEEVKRRLEEEKKRQEEEKRQERIKKYGEEIASLIEKGEVSIGMTKEAVLESIQNKKKIYDITYNQNQEFWQANRNKAKKYIQYEMPKSAEEAMAGMFMGAILQGMGLSEDYLKALFKYDYLEFKDGVLVSFREWQDRGNSSPRYYSNPMSLFGL